MAETKTKTDSCSSGAESLSDMKTDNIMTHVQTSASAVVRKNRIDKNNKLWVPIQSLNEYIVCGICHGYLYEATTITECMHSFCKSCIVRHLERSLQCPTCRVLIHPTDPFVNMRMDRLLQDIVYGVLPALAEEEFAREEEFYKQHDARLNTYQKVGGMPGSLQSRGSSLHHSLKTTAFLPQISLLLNCKCSSPLQKRLDRRYVRVTGEATVHHVACLIRKKLMLTKQHQVEVFGSCSDGCVSLETSHTLSAVKALHFQQEDCIQLEYEIRPWS